jgi:hypothetical protein
MIDEPSSKEERGFLQKRFQFLLASLLLLFIVLPFFEYSVVTNVVISVILLFGTYAVAQRKTVLIMSVILAVLSLVTTWTGYFIEAKSFLLAGYGFAIAFFTLVSAVILWQVLSHREVTSETIAGSICVYLLLGVIWANVYALLETIEPHSFSGNEAQVESVEGPLSPQTRSTRFSYYSFVTLTTLGYGEITPLTRPARNLAALEAIVGQLYLAVLVARLVGLHIVSKDRRECD